MTVFVNGVMGPNYTSNNRLSSPRFSSSAQLMKAFNKSAPLLKALDYTILGDTLVKQSMVIYACIIGSRVAMARTNNERLEVLRRDPLGWYMWFMGKPLFEWAIIRTATARQPQVRDLLLNYSAPKSTLGSIISFINPPAQYYSSTQKQLAQRYQQIKTQMLSQATGVRQLKKLTQLFTKANNILVMTSFAGLVLTILGLGIGINLLNIALTRRNVERAKRLQELKEQSVPTGGNPATLSLLDARVQMQRRPVIMA